MAPNNGLSGSTLAIHPQRNVPSSLLKKRCAEKFAQVLQEYGEEEGHAVKWALIIESGKANKMLLISIYGKREFPIAWVNEQGIPVSMGESESEDEFEGKAEDGNDTKDQGEAKDESEAQGEGEAKSEGSMLGNDEKHDKQGGEGLKGNDGKKPRGNEGKASKGGDGEKLKDDGGKKKSKEDKKKKSNGGDKKKSKGGDNKKTTQDADAKKLGEVKEDDEPEDYPIFTITERYKVTGISDEEDNPGLDSALGLDTKKQAGLEENYEIVGTIMNGEVEWMCDLPQYQGFEDKTTYFNKDGLSMVHGVRFHDRIKERKLAALAELDRKIEEEHQIFLAEQKARKAAKKARQKAGLKPEHSEGPVSKGEKAKAKRLRQKQNREKEAEEMKLMAEEREKTQEAAARDLFKQHTGQDLKAEDIESRIMVVDGDTPEGQLLIAEAAKKGAKILQAKQID